MVRIAERRPPPRIELAHANGCSRVEKTADSSAGLGVTNRKATQTASPVAESSNMPEGYYAGSVDRISLPNS
jgi:hypothetical protein